MGCCTKDIGTAECPAGPGGAADPRGMAAKYPPLQWAAPKGYGSGWHEKAVPKNKGAERWPKQGDI